MNANLDKWNEIDESTNRLMEHFTDSISAIRIEENSDEQILVDEMFMLLYYLGLLELK